MLTYAQIEAIHEAMRELEGEEISHEALGVTFTHFDSYDVRSCLAKIRAALAGEKASDDGSP